MWWDEAALALNILDRSPAQLSAPLDHGQAAPVGFLLLVKLLTTLLGDSEYALRGVALAAGMSSVLLFHWVARRLLRPWGLLISTALFAFSLPLIRYSAELKQYSTDTALALLLVGVALRSSSPSSASQAPEKLRLGLLGAACVWFSHPSVFVLAAIAATWLGLAAWRRDARRARDLLPLGTLWTLSFAAVYFVSLRETVGNEFLQDFWSGSGPGAPSAGAFMPWPPRSTADLLWAPRALRTVLNFCVPLPHVALSATAWMLGLLALSRRDVRSIGIWQLALLFALGASAIHRYPFATRLLLFASPAFLLPIGAGLDVLAGLTRPRAARAFGALLALLAAGYSFQAALNANVPPPQNWEIRGALQTFLEQRAPDDTLYVYYGAELPMRYYAPRFGLEREDYVLGVNSRHDWTEYERDLRALDGQGRVWVLFSQFLEQERAFFREVLGRTRTEVELFRSQKVELGLYLKNG